MTAALLESYTAQCWLMVYIVYVGAKCLSYWLLSNQLHPLLS